MLLNPGARMVILRSGRHQPAKSILEICFFLMQGDVSGLMDKIQDVIPEDKQPELLDSIQKVSQGAVVDWWTGDTRA
jgi:hypothetical protein